MQFSAQLTVGNNWVLISQLFALDTLSHCCVPAGPFAAGPYLRSTLQVGDIRCIYLKLGQRTAPAAYLDAAFCFSCRDTQPLSREKSQANSQLQLHIY